MSKTLKDAVVLQVPDGLLITTPITSGVRLCLGNPLIQRQGPAKMNYDVAGIDDPRATNTRELLFHRMSKTSEDAVVLQVPDGLLITTPITSGAPLRPGNPLIQRQGLAKMNYDGAANGFESATYELKSITDRIYRISDRLIIEYSSLYEKIMSVEKKLERMEAKIG